MLTRNLGQSGITVSAIGLGCMGLSEFYGKPLDEREAVNLLHEAVGLGINHFDTAEIYGQGRNEELLGKAFAGGWDSIVLATKFGPQRDPSTGAFTGVDASPANVRKSCENSLKRLGTDIIDLYYLHRMDKSVPIEDTVDAMAELVKEGKIRAIGLSEASAETIARAHAVHPVTAVQSEYSIFSRDIEKDVIPKCMELGISIIAYAPLGRGMLTGRYSSEDDRPNRDDDFRSQMQPRFQPGNFEVNLKLVEAIRKIAVLNGCMPSQVALGWLLKQGKHVAAIPGTTKTEHLKTNISALDCVLSDDNMKLLNTLAKNVAGERYMPGEMSALNR